MLVSVAIQVLWIGKPCTEVMTKLTDFVFINFANTGSKFIADNLGSTLDKEYSIEVNEFVKEEFDCRNVTFHFPEMEESIGQLDQTFKDVDFFHLMYYNRTGDFGSEYVRAYEREKMHDKIKFVLYFFTQPTLSDKTQIEKVVLLTTCFMDKMDRMKFKLMNSLRKGLDILTTYIDLNNGSNSGLIDVYLNIIDQTNSVFEKQKDLCSKLSQQFDSNDLKCVAKIEDVRSNIKRRHPELSVDICEWYGKGFLYGNTNQSAFQTFSNGTNRAMVRGSGHSTYLLYKETFNDPMLKHMYKSDLLAHISKNQSSVSSNEGEIVNTLNASTFKFTVCP